MSSSTLSKATGRCREAALRLAWSQWSVLGGQVGGRFTEPSAVVDPEALVLFSCALRDDEPRLWDLVGGFLREGSSLLSVQRTRNLAATFPERVRAVLPEVAAIAVADGKDPRWRPLAGPKPRAYRTGKVYRPARSVADPPALILRLRLAFGVHARTDALAFLLATAPAGATVREVADATGYGTMPLRRALDAMAMSRLITAEGTRPEQYHVVAGPWAALLGGTGPLPKWRYWYQLFAFLAAVLPSPPATAVRERSAYLESGDLRRLVLQHKTALAKNRIPVPEPADYPGEEFLAGFAETLAAVAGWMGENG
jgi:hypothetical protein